MLERNTALKQRLEQLTHLFRACFRRREQAEWAAVYLQGLLQPGTRKTIANLCRSVTPPHGMQVDDVVQALQHFLNQSPWDEQKLQRHYYALLNERLGPGGLLVLDELAFVKQGRHSVGVQRQYSALLRRKVNCQLAVALHHLSSAGLRPLGLRLYLPRRWVEDKNRLDKAGVPSSARRLASKTMLALELLDEVRAAGISTTNVVLGIPWGRGDDLLESVIERGWIWRAEVPPNLLETLYRGRDELHNELGLDHFEGRSWRGFHHHACLVVLACDLLICSRDKIGGTS
ncbi:MAG TPA: transposase [Gemmataceae bacterium]|nr:transposase [Gemmataceae bacterium]